MQAYQRSAFLRRISQQLVMKSIDPTDLVPMDIFTEIEPIAIDLVYAKADHPRNIFDDAIYHNTARLWAHKDIAAITLLTARILNQKQNWILELKDCFRSVDAQTAMQETDIVRAHPEWCTDGPDRLLSPPGKGAHPRGMAIDVCVTDNDNLVDMGSEFDQMDEKSARDYSDFSTEILQNRNNLNMAFTESADALNLPLYLVASEWWDFRLPSDIYNEYEPLSDKNLPPQMQMTQKIDNGIADFDDTHFTTLADQIRTLVDKAYADF